MWYGRDDDEMEATSCSCHHKERAEPSVSHHDLAVLSRRLDELYQRERMDISNLLTRLDELTGRVNGVVSNVGCLAWKVEDAQQKEIETARQIMGLTERISALEEMVRKQQAK